MKSENCLTLSIDNENRPFKQLIDPSKLEECMFSPQYKLFLDQLEHYLKAIEGAEDDFEVDSNNNIFAIIGDRGSGKTSCMLSLAGLLADESLKSKLDKNKYYSICKKRFVLIDLIDPGYFDKNHNLLEFFVAKLYKEFLHVKKSKNNSDLIKEQNFTRHISETQRNLQYMLSNKPEEAFESLSKLSSLASSIELKRNIYDLVNAYLSYIDVSDAILVVRVDDVDLNESEATKMVEVMRKYLIQKNIVILTALKLNQLEELKKVEFEINCKTTTSDIENKVGRYMAKLFPYSQRIYLPNTEIIMNSKLRVESQKQNKWWEFDSVKTSIPQLIFAKTHYLFYNTKNRPSRVVPRNLRDLLQLIKMLVMMDDYSKECKTDTNSYNQQLFRTYLFDTWAKNHISESMYKKLLQIAKTRNLQYFNSVVLESLQSLELVVDNKKDKEKKSLEFQLGQPHYHLSLGDILAYLEILETIYVDEESLNFFFLLRSLYSIKLYEAYDEVTEPNNTAGKKEVGKKECDKIYLDEQNSSLNDYERLVCGTHFNTMYTPLIPTLKSNTFLIPKELFVNAVQDYYKNRKNFNKVQGLEFVMLCISRAALKDSPYEYRLKNRVTYDIYLAGDYLVFDIASLFYNLTRIEKCYNRFKGLGEPVAQFVEDILEISNQKHNLYGRSTLYRKIKDFCMEEKRDGITALNVFDNNRWLSYSSFRNVEIITDFRHWVCEQQQEQSNYAKYLCHFLDIAGQYKLHRYPYTTPENGRKIDPPGTIDFKFLKHCKNAVENNEHMIQRFLTSAQTEDSKGGANIKFPTK